MQVTEKDAAGLSRTFAVSVPRSDLAKRLDARITEIQPQVRLKGFRPGKVPASHIRKIFGRDMLKEIIDDTVNDTTQSTLAERDLRAAAFPEIILSSDLEKVVSGEADLDFEMRVELMPKFTPTDPASLTLERPVYPVGQEEIDETLARLASENKVFETKRKGAKAAEGDMLVTDFVGSIDGVPFEGGAAEGSEIEIGAGRLIPGFEEQLIGAKAGDAVEVKLNFPDDYPRAELAGKPAVFAVTVHEVKAPKEGAVDDELAIRLGLPDLATLTEAVKANLERNYASQSRARLKRRLLDALDSQHDFELPARMVEAEFNQIWAQVQRDMASGETPEEDAGKSEDELKAEYRTIAVRRVRLGLVLAEIGRAAGVEVTDEELSRAVAAEARRYPGQEGEVARFLTRDANARAQLRAPIYEEKVVDNVLSRAQVTDVEVSRDELFADEDAPGEAAAPKPKAKAKAKAKPAKEADAEEASEPEAKPAKSAKAPAKPKAAAKPKAGKDAD